MPENNGAQKFFLQATAVQFAGWQVARK